MRDIFARYKLSNYQINPEGGMIYVDWKVKHWLDSFKNGDYRQKSKKEKEIYKKITKSDFQENLMIKPPVNVPAISLIVVTFNSEIWFENLKKMIINLSPWLHETIVVDNGSIDGSLDGFREFGDLLQIIQNEESKSFAAAVNQGVKLASGELFLIINPDVYIPKSSFWSLINFYKNNSDAAAIVPKLMLMKTPGFVNGIGNIVPAFRWGYDLGLGHLDVGQFDQIKEVPSACFATVLIPREKWNKVGELDEEFPMYYEDSDWSYRARGLGYKIFVDTSCCVYHAYSGNIDRNATISKKKLFNVTYGKLRFTWKNIDKPKCYYFYLSYVLFDFLFIIYTLVINKFNLGEIKPVVSGWIKFLNKKNLSNYFTTRSGEIFIRPKNGLNTTIVHGVPLMRWRRIKKMLLL